MKVETLPESLYLSAPDSGGRDGVHILMTHNLPEKAKHLRFPVVSHGAEFLVQGYLMRRNILAARVSSASSYR